MNQPNMSLHEIQIVLGISKNKAKALMKNKGVQHDGTPEMRYAWNEANPVIEKFIDSQKREKERRTAISKRRASTSKNFSNPLTGSMGRVDGNTIVLDNVEDISEEPVTYSRIKAAEILEVTPYNIKEAVRLGILTANSRGRVFMESVENIKTGNLLHSIFSLKQYPLENAAKIVGLESSALESVLTKRGISSLPNGMWRGSDLLPLIDVGQLNFAIQPSTYMQKEENFDADERVSVNIPRRTQPLMFTAFHLGPTNSGKTYKALESLCAEFEANPQGRYVYSGPLRMLAYEVYSKMAERYGAENVGFITGEESVNPDAPIIAATVEMTPLQGDVVIIDEAHWILDSERGHYWTRLLISGNYTKMHVIAAQEAEEGLRVLVADALETETHVFERRTKISYDGTIHINKIPEKTAVVCFSRNDVYKVYDRLLESGKKACVLYGALPVEVRKKQIQDYENGVFDIVVTTNVIGHGINLPIDNVVFAGTERFDGDRMIELPLWEAGQISGRAGRFGLSEKGRVYILEGMEDIEPEPTLIRGGVNVAAGRLESGLEVEKVFVSPKFADLGLDLHENMHLVETLNAWSSKIQQETEFLPAPLNIARKNLKAIVSHLSTSMVAKDYYSGKNPWLMNAENLWILASGPFDPRGDVILPAAEWLNSRKPEESHEIRRAFTMIAHADRKMDLEALESSFKAVSEFKMLAVAFGKDGMIGTLSEAAIHSMERELIDLIQWKLENYARLTNSPDERN